MSVSSLSYEALHTSDLVNGMICSMHCAVPTLCSLLLTKLFHLFLKECDPISPLKWTVKAFHCPVYAVGVLVSVDLETRWFNLR